MSPTIQEIIDQAVRNGYVPGVAVLVDRAGEISRYTAGSWSPGGPPLDLDAIVRIQSMTKPMTAAATLRLVEAGRLRLDDPVETWLPELADRRVLRHPQAAIEDVVPAVRPIQVRDLLVNASGYGIDITESTPWGRAMKAAGVDAGPSPVTLDAQDWLDRLAGLPLVHQPGHGFRYHHSFAVLGILLSRLTGMRLQDHLAADLFGPLGMTDTGFWAPDGSVPRLPPAYRLVDGKLQLTEPAAGGIWAGEPAIDVSHNELLSTLDDVHRFAAMLRADGRLPDGTRWLSSETIAEMTRDQLLPEAKTPDSFFPGFWEAMGWGYGLGVQTAGAHPGRYGWSGGQATDFFVDPVDGTIGIVFIQVDLCLEVWSVLHALRESI